MTAKLLAVAALAGGGAVGAKAIATGDLPIAGGTQASQSEGDGAAPSSERRGDETPDPVGSRRQERSGDEGSRASKRRDTERSHGRRGIERRAERADERAAGPKLDAGRPRGATNPRATERGAPAGRRQDIAKRPEAEPRSQAPSVEKPSKAPAAQPAPKQVPEPTPQSAPETAPGPALPDAPGPGAQGSGKANGIARGPS